MTFTQLSGDKGGKKKKKKSFDVFVHESALKNPGNLFDDEALEIKTEDIQLGSPSGIQTGR